ncbi:hypothetical protein MAP00_003066 [Monascus purpureus]|nr:hypothetical protein MAP00_003066 [Monascus purpureus]
MIHAGDRGSSLNPRLQPAPFCFWSGHRLDSPSLPRPNHCQTFSLAPLGVSGNCWTRWSIMLPHAHTRRSQRHHRPVEAYVPRVVCINLPTAVGLPLPHSFLSPSPFVFYVEPAEIRLLRQIRGFVTVFSLISGQSERFPLSD